VERWAGALEHLVRERGPALVSYAAMLCGSRAEAEDIVQDAVVKVFSRPGGPLARAVVPDDGPGVRSAIAHDDLRALEAYTRRAILTTYLDRYRHRRPWPRVLRLSAQPDRLPDPVSGPGADRHDVAAALRLLTPRQRACVVLRYIDDLTVPAIAVELGLVEGTVKRHLHDAVAVLRTLLGDGRAVDRPHGLQHEEVLP
jgi:RNA polymerase sigma-70 factor (ECF subfamily)